ncbi:SPRY domain-containing protein 7 isoform X2 [Rhagoletis pomonella]|uniref:SPRY domain-containing protein 7 isoform X1 n=1 Tax=Rhagoletis pomonella TaxID=28610 RepID=UPI001784ECB2|nr:SPRY domain-containing protein 7 isoform X1 [Rhagoletis pomonella]XP_036335905.1 SPRY domain-containing protein 7 isoform X2 [Rhagoletis pomonella]
MFCCLRTCLNGSIRKTTSSANRQREPEIYLDSSFAGPDAILLSKQLRITGSGGALATAPLVQSKSYFEIKIQQSGSWSVGLATRQADLTKKFGGCDKESWCLCSDNSTRHNDEVFRPVVITTQEPTSASKPLINGTAAAAGLIGIEDVPEDNLLSNNVNVNSEIGDNLIMQPQHSFPEEGDIVGIAFDHIELNFYFNGKSLEVPFRNVKGTVYPVIFVGNGAILDIILDKFHYEPPPGFDKIMLEQSLL